MKVQQFLLFSLCFAASHNLLLARQPLDAIRAKDFDAALEYIKSNPEDLAESVNDTLKHRLTSLHLLARSKNTEVEKRIELMNVLIENGAEINARSKKGRTPLHIAILAGQTSIALALCEKGADVNALTSLETSALYFAAQKSNVEVIQALLNRDVDPKTTAPDGQTALHAAALTDATDAIKLLVSNNVDVDVRCNRRMTPLHYAASTGKTKAVAILLELGASVDPIDEVGWTPLHWASNKGHLEVIRLLVDCKADVNKLDGTYNATPKYLAHSPEVRSELSFLGGHMHGPQCPHNDLLCWLSGMVQPRTYRKR